MGHRNKHFTKSTRVGEFVDTRHVDIEDAPDTNVDYASDTPGQRGWQYPLIPVGNIPAGGSAEGRWYYDVTNHLPKFDNGTDIITFASGAAGSLNTSYDAGAIINIDAAGGDLELDLADSSTDKNVQIKNIVAGTITTGLLFDTENASASCILTNAIQFTCSGAGSSIGTALNVSDAGIGTAIDIGVNLIAGTNFSVDTSGNITCVGVAGSGALVTSLSASSNAIQVNTNKFTVKGDSGNTLVAGTLDVTGTSTLAGAVTVDSIVGETTKALAIAAANAQALTLDADTTGTITIGGTSTGNITLGIDGTTSQIKLNATSVLFSGGFTFGGTVVASNGIQLNGSLIAFDTNDDSGLQSPSDNQIDVELNGAAEYGFELARLDMNNNDLEECGHITLVECDAFPAGTEVFIGREDDGDLRLNCLTGKEVEIATADTVMAAFDSNTLAFKQATDITTSATTLTLTPTTDVVVADTKGLIVGGGAQTIIFSADETASFTPELQVQGTTIDDSSIVLVRGSADAFGGVLSFAKGRDALGTYTTVVNANDAIGSIVWYGADTSDMRSLAASLTVEVDATAAVNDMPGRMVFSTTADGAIAVTEAMRIDCAQDVRCTAGLIVGSTTVQVTATNASEFQVLGSAAADSGALIGAFSAGAAIANAPELAFVKSNHATVGSNTTVANNDFLGSINWNAADGTDFATISAAIRARVDDAAIAESQVGGELLFYTALGDGNDDLTEAVRIDADQLVEFAGGLGVKATTPHATTGINADYLVNTTSGLYGINYDLNVADTTGANANINRAGYFNACVDVTNTNNWTDTVGFRGVEGSVEVENGATGTITGMASFYASADSVEDVTITARHGLYVANSAGDATVTTQYGVYIEDLQDGAADIGVYIAGADTAAIHVAADPSAFEGGVYGALVTTRDLILKPNVADDVTGCIQLGGDGVLGVCIGGDHDDAWAAKNNYLWLADTTISPAGNPSGNSGAGIVAIAGELWAIDDLGGTTQLSPHDENGEWVFNSHYKGKKTLIQMERLVKKLAEMFPELAEFIKQTVDETL